MREGGLLASEEGDEGGRLTSQREVDLLASKGGDGGGTLTSQ